MPEYPTNLPPAGWYADPSNAAQERWWGGVEWTHDVRPLAAPVLAPQPALANVPGGGINPFAASEPEQGYGADAFGSTGFSPASGSGGLSGYDPAMGAGFDQSFVTMAPWQQSGRPLMPTPPPSNGQSTAGLVLSLVGVGPLGIIFSVIGLRKARDFEADGELPVGRKRSRWGLGLGIASVILNLALAAAFLTGFQYFQALYLQQTAAVAEREGVPESDVVIDANGLPAVYNRAEIERTYYEGFTEQGLSVDLVTCPDQARMVVGGGFECSFVMDGATHTVGVTWTTNTGEFTSTIDGVIQN